MKYLSFMDDCKRYPLDGHRDSTRKADLMKGT